MKPLWTPSKEQIEKSTLTVFAQSIQKKHNLKFSNYSELHTWSIKEKEFFWNEVWDFCQVQAQTKGSKILIHQEQMPGAQFFPEAKLNYAENLLAHCSLQDSSTALVFWSEDKIQKEISKKELYQKVSQCAQALRKLGIQKGDRVAGFLPNMPEAIIAMLATTSIGAIWSSASPDFGVQGVVDRFGQIEPKVLFAVDGYWYNGKPIDCTAKVQEIIPKLPSLKKTVIVSLLNKENTWDDFLNSHTSKKIEFDQVEFNHPLFVMYSSGTTGVPKCIVHGHGGTLLQHLKEHQLHGNVKPHDRLFYFTTLGWMMWNWLVTGLASNATLMLYDGSPFAKEGNILYDFAQKYRCTHFGTSAKYIDSCAKTNLKPIQTHDLSSVESIFSTGSPLSPESFDYVYENIKKDVQLASISGGTDIVSCFMLGNPWSAVYRGEIQGPGLGMDVKIFSEDGSDITKSKNHEKGELVCASPFPSMPVSFWNDPDGKKYFEAYFARYENIWCHGDFISQTENGGYIIHGRSDAVLNPGGVRIGTAEIYRQVEKLPEVTESIVIGQDWQSDVRVVLFVKLKEGLKLDEDLQNKIKKVIRENTTPRHVPAKILQVKDIPRTKSGKIVELAVRKVVHGEAVKNMEALANPEALEEFKNREELKN